MEWIVVTAKTLHLAIEQALDTLGVHETELEYVVEAEAKSGFLGIRRSDAKIRARVKPISREKPNDKRRRKQQERKSKGGSKPTGTKADANGGGGSSPKHATGSKRSNDEASEVVEALDSAPKSSSSRSRSRNRNTKGPKLDVDDARQPSADGIEDVSNATTRTKPSNEQTPTAVRLPPNREAIQMSTGTIEEQMTHARDFAEGFIESFGLEASIAVNIVDEDVVEVAISGTNLGLLVGPKGATLAAVEELLRGSVGHRGPARLHLDVAGYRQKRREALSAFALSVANQVIESGSAKALEPMSSQDRKVVHDAVSALEGVSTISDGEDARRRVIIQPSVS